MLTCVSTDGTFSAQPCGATSYPVHVVVDGGGGAASNTPTTASGIASAQLVGAQDGGANALPVSVTDKTMAQLVMRTQLVAATLDSLNDAAAASTETVVAQLCRIATPLATTPNSILNAVSEQHVHMTNLLAILAVIAPDVGMGAQSMTLNTAGNAVSLALNGQAALGLAFAGVSGSNATLPA